MLTDNWTKSSKSEGSNCVEAKTDDIVRVRDSKDPDGGELGFEPEAWTAFLDQVKVGAHDL